MSNLPDKSQPNDIPSDGDAEGAAKSAAATPTRPKTTRSEGYSEAYGVLDVCAREPIHIPGTIQPHGMLLAVDVETDTVRYVSANSDAFLGYAPNRLLEQPLDNLLSPSSYEKIQLLVADLHERRVRIDQPEKRITSLDVRVLNADAHQEHFAPFDVTMHLSHTLSAQTQGTHPLTWRGGLHKDIDTDTTLVNPERSMLVLELEPLSHASVSFNEVQRSLEYLRSAKNITQLLEMTTETVAELTGYDRVMAYRFAEDGHGEIVAEVLQQPASDGSTLESYLHLHYPASDIPEQARRLYLLNHVRAIGHNDYSPVPLLTTPDATSSEPTNSEPASSESASGQENPAAIVADGSQQAARALDLSLADLRSVSPIHLEYMRNMGTAASLVTSLVVDDELWGMIVCHHSSPRTANVHMRGLMEFISDLVSLLIAERNYSTAYQTRLVRQEQLRAFTQYLLQSNDLDAAAQVHADMLLELTDAHGIAFCFVDNTIHQLGSTPPLTVIQALHQHLQQRTRTPHGSKPEGEHPTESQGEHQYQGEHQGEYRYLAISNSISTDFASLEAVRDAANSHTSQGLLYVPINDTSPPNSNDAALPKHFVMWFRDELVETIRWGGDPNKTVQKQNPPSSQRVSPRKSFAAWQETVRGKAKPWQDLEISIVLELRHTIGAALLKRTEHQLTELRLRTEQVRESNMAKSEFLSRVSHELRTPLNAILGFAQVLSMRKLNDSQSRGVSRILEAGKHLLNLVDEVLDISRVDAGNLSLSLEAVSLWEIVTTCMDIVQPLAADKRVTLECTVDSVDNHNNPYVSADRQRLKQVFINLLANAIKYNRDDGHVTVSFVVQDQNTVCVRVVDTGIGIAADKMPRLFSPFDRLDIEHDSNIQGTGLGLTLTKSLVEAMKGDIGAESVLGQGTTFWFTLPLAHISQSPKTRPASASSANTPPSIKVAMSNKRKLMVLYIEDNTSDVEFVQYQLADYRDVQLMSSPRADKGKTLALQYQPDVIVVDQFLPDMDSSDLIRQLRDHKTMQQVTIVGLISPSEDGNALQEAGTDFVLSKPLELANLLDALQDTASD